LLIDWLLLSQAFEGGHFKKIEISFPPRFGASDTTLPYDGFPRRIAPVLVGPIGGTRFVGAVNRGSLLERIANRIQ
jgi:hypothetical protein